MFGKPKVSCEVSVLLDALLSLQIYIATEYQASLCADRFINSHLLEVLSELRKEHIVTLVTPYQRIKLLYIAAVRALAQGQCQTLLRPDSKCSSQLNPSTISFSNRY